MPFVRTTSECLEQKENLRYLIANHGHKILNEKGEITGYDFLDDYLNPMTPYQCWYFVRNGKFTKQPNPPKGFIVPENPNDWVISVEESLAKEAKARDAKSRNKARR